MDISVFSNKDTGQLAAQRGDILIVVHAAPPNNVDWAKKMFGIYDQNPQNIAVLKLVSQFDDELTPDEEAPQPGPDVPGQQDPDRKENGDE